MMKYWRSIIVFIVLVCVFWLATTSNSWVWPRRNYLQYTVLRWWWNKASEPQSGPTGSLRGRVHNSQGQPVAGAWAVVSRWDGTTYTARSQADGEYHIPDIPAGKYLPVVGASGYAPVFLDGDASGIWIEPDQETLVETTLTAAVPRPYSPGEDLVLSEPAEISCTSPIETSGIRRTVTFDSGGQPNQLTLFYTPANATPNDQYPLLITVYPGPADSWECASLPLAAAGYAVIAVGPAYSFDLDVDVDELERLLDFAQAGQFPNTDATRIAALAGSYSGLHVQLLMQRERGDLAAAILLGAPTDIYTMRRHLEAGTYIPPFGLDQALISLGLPDRQPNLYWKGSGIYHVSESMPPLLIIHSHDDEVIPIAQSDLLIERLKEAGISHQVHYFEGASHYLLSPGGESQAIYDLVLEFLATHLE